MTKRPEGMLFNDDEDDFGTNLRKNSRQKPEEPQVQVKPKPIIESPPVEIKKEPPPNIAPNNTNNNPPAKKKQLFSDSDSNNSSDSDDVDPREKELKERLARMQANKLNK